MRAKGRERKGVEQGERSKTGHLHSGIRGGGEKCRQGVKGKEKEEKKGLME